MNRSQISERIKVFIRERPDFHAGAGKPSAADEGIAGAGPRGDSRGADRDRGGTDRGEKASGVQSVAADRKSCVYSSNKTQSTQQTFKMDRYFSPDQDQAQVWHTYDYTTIL
jgi:hypothetical protein